MGGGETEEMGRGVDSQYEDLQPEGQDVGDTANGPVVSLPKEGRRQEDPAILGVRF